MLSKKERLESASNFLNQRTNRSITALYNSTTRWTKSYASKKSSFGFLQNPQFAQVSSPSSGLSSLPVEVLARASSMTPLRKNSEQLTKRWRSRRKSCVNKCVANRDCKSRNSLPVVKRAKKKNHSTLTIINSRGVDSIAGWRRNRWWMDTWTIMGYGRKAGKSTMSLAPSMNYTAFLWSTQSLKDWNSEMSPWSCFRNLGLYL